MKKTGLNRAYTIAELLAIIAILSIITLGVSQFNFKTVSNSQKLTIFSNNIISNIESVRNFGLLGKGIDSLQTIPNQWQISFDATGSGKINFAFNTGTLVAYPEFDIVPAVGSHYEINNFKCLDISGGLVTSYNGTDKGIVIIEGRNLTLTGACDPGSQILRFDTRFQGQTETIEFNTLNGLLNVKK